MSRLQPLPLLVLASMALAAQATAQAREPFSVPLECQLESGGWHPCTMTVERIGEHWWLQVGQRRFDLRHDGQGPSSCKRRPGPREKSPRFGAANRPSAGTGSAPRETCRWIRPIRPSAAPEPLKHRGIAQARPVPAHRCWDGPNGSCCQTNIPAWGPPPGSGGGGSCQAARPDP